MAANTNRVKRKLPSEEPNADLRSFVNTSLVDMVADRIRTNIYNGRYPSGKKLIVRELSEEFGVSHTPVKDALNRLIAEGYVEALPRRSMVVRTYTNSDLIESLQIRLMIEIYCAREIIETARIQPTIVKELQGILEKMRKCLAEKENLQYETWVKYETMFHQTYMQHCGNAKMLGLYKGLDTNRITYFAYLGSSHAPLKISTLESNLREHWEIAESIATLDAQRLINAVIQHMFRACEDYAVDEESLKKIILLKRMTEKFRT